MLGSGVFSFSTVLPEEVSVRLIMSTQMRGRQSICQGNNNKAGILKALQTANNKKEQTH